MGKLIFIIRITVDCDVFLPFCTVLCTRQCEAITLKSFFPLGATSHYLQPHFMLTALGLCA
jgi:hypothetical protein